MRPNLYSIWHLNLLYSSIEEDRRLEVIQKCFWPLLNLAKNGYKVALEIPASSLEIALQLDPAWVKVFKELLYDKKIELVGSGYTQLISPTLPAKVNSTNIDEGFKVYKEILNIHPEVWLINEQAFSDSLISLYSEFKNIKAVIIDWCSLFGNTPELDENLVFEIQNLKSSAGKSIPVIWSHSIAFQKFQHVIHNQIDESEFFEYYDKIFTGMTKTNLNQPSFCLYGNDAEVFDFRPGRFHTEATAPSYSEWSKIDKIFKDLALNFNYIFPSELLHDGLNKCSDININSLREPVTVKKQPKYNICRWNLTGRNTPYINSILLSNAVNIDQMDSSKKRELCYLFSSDFRTHITEKRWTAFFQSILDIDHRKHLAIINEDNLTSTQKNYLENDLLYLQLNSKKGGSVERVGLKNLPYLFGRVKHGFFSRMDICADWFSSNLVFQEFGRPQATDLSLATILSNSSEKNTLVVKSNFLNGSVDKLFSLHENSFILDYQLNIPKVPIGCFRFSFITFNPEEICPTSFKIETHCGGYDMTTFSLPNYDFSHGENPTNIVSSNNIFPMTENFCNVYTKNYILKIEILESCLIPMAMIKHKIAREGRLLRLFFSLSEVDETRKCDWSFSNVVIKFKFTLTPRNT